MTYIEAIAELKEMGVFTAKKNFNIILKRSWGASKALTRNPVEKKYVILEIDYDEFGDQYSVSSKPAKRYEAPMEDLFDDDWIPVSGDKVFANASKAEMLTIMG